MARTTAPVVPMRQLICSMPGCRQPATARALSGSGVSLTLKGHLDGQECLLTARGMTAAEFKRNLEAIRGVLDPVSIPTRIPQAPPQGQNAELHWCRAHQVQMTENVKDNRRWWSHRLPEGGFCKGK